MRSIGRYTDQFLTADISISNIKIWQVLVLGNIITELVNSYNQIQMRKHASWSYFARF